MRNGLLLFGVMVLAQWLLPWRTVRERERIVQQGVPFLFRTAPVDPHDPFRGEYVTLRFALEDEHLATDTTRGWQDGQDAFLLLKNTDGEAAIASVQGTPPTDGSPYVHCTLNVWQYDPDTLVMQVDLPFDRFYLKEGSGRHTEELVNTRNIEVGPELPAYALVRVLDGEAVIQDLIVGDRPIKEWVKE